MPKRTGTKGISVKSKKMKGRLLQQWVRDQVINRLKPFGILPEDVKSNPMGSQGEDVLLSPFARGFFPYSTECKSHSSMAVYNWYEQSCKNAGKHEPLLVVKADRKKPLVVVDAEHFFDLVETALKSEEHNA